MEAVGGVENFSPWSLKVRTVESECGSISLSLHDVQSGYVEGFRSHYTPGSVMGIAVRYSLLIDDDIYLHIMYKVRRFPLSRFPNWLSIALCGKDNTECTTLDAKKMYYNKYPFLDKQSYYKPPYSKVKKCFNELCVEGMMDGEKHTPVLYVKLFPKSYYHLAANVRGRLASVGVTQNDYEHFIKKEFNL